MCVCVCVCIKISKGPMRFFDKETLDRENCISLCTANVSPTTQQTLQYRHKGKPNTHRHNFSGVIIRFFRFVSFFFAGTHITLTKNVFQKTFLAISFLKWFF